MSVETDPTSGRYSPLYLNVGAAQAASNASPASSLTGTLTIEPPPLVLVHGIWSSAAQAWGGSSGFKDWLSTNYPQHTVVPADYKPYNSLTFANPATQQILTLAIANALATAAGYGIVASKVDVVAHSMGGLVTRSFMDNGVPIPFASSYLPASPIHKLITIGTPHQGTNMAVELDTNQMNTSNSITFSTYCLLNGILNCSLANFLASQGNVVSTGTQSLETGFAGDSSSYDYSAIAGLEPTSSAIYDYNAHSATEEKLSSIINAFIPGQTDQTILGGTNNDTLVTQTSQVGNATNAVTISNVVHTALPDTPDVGETQSSCVWNQAVFWLLGGTGPFNCSGQAMASSNLTSSEAASPLTTSSAPIFDLTGFTQVGSSNVIISPASGSRMTIGAATNISATSSTKTITEVLLFQTVTDPTDIATLYSTQSPFSISFTPTRLGSANFAVFAVFSDDTFAAMPLSYAFQPSGSAANLTIQAPVASLPVGLTTIVPAQVAFAGSPIYVDVTNAATYTAGSGGTKVFSVGTNGSITSTGNGVDFLNVSYSGVSASAQISVGSCTYTLGPTNQIVQQSGGTASIQVTTQTGCSWTASAGFASWITLSGASGTGSGTIYASTQANNTGSTQTGYITVDGQDVAVIQPGSACTYGLGTTQIQAPAVGASGSITVTTSCPVIAASSQSWAIATALSSSVNYFIAANPSTSVRSATITIGNETVQITQAALITPTVTVSASPSSITTGQALGVTVSVGGGTGNPTPTGSVTLSGGGYTSAATTMGGGSAMINVPAGSLAVGSDLLTVNYTPDSNSSSTYSSASGSNTVTVSKITPTVSVTPNPSSITTAQALSVTATVSGGSGNPIPTGSVTLSGAGYTSAATTLSGGSAMINVPAGSLAKGTDLLTVSYSGDSNFNTTTGTASVTVTVPPPPSFTVSGTSVSVEPGAASGNTSTVTVTPANGFTGSVVLTAAVTSSPLFPEFLPTLSFGTTSPVSVTGANAGTATLTISATAATSAALSYPRRPGFPGTQRVAGPWRASCSSESQRDGAVGGPCSEC